MAAAVFGSGPARARIQAGNGCPPPSSTGDSFFQVAASLSTGTYAALSAHARPGAGSKTNANHII